MPSDGSNRKCSITNIGFFYWLKANLFEANILISQRHNVLQFVLLSVIFKFHMIHSYHISPSYVSEINSKNVSRFNKRLFLTMVCRFLVAMTEIILEIKKLIKSMWRRIIALHISKCFAVTSKGDTKFLEPFDFLRVVSFILCFPWSCFIIRSVYNFSA